ncbi:redoxin domain-containing protein [Candidatus Purcelliella pentastirinorum]|uniref:Alkyl hydroperoxide reductase protein C22 n=1 Tax=Candidatus Purcelliella pentastirinorum TaxID=472834 RepID=A0AAX3N9T3_9ENTR|nr:redoxin domain-containing protein [Candidatus Purcelliella pentastirinorum]WDI78749.1 redoxin domain-containing protein [Candidatus Purcelliella pentastirinorum]WDR80732.1 redoxin domain-containing protein [Candidatus Purcelliella pentastirinorum]
MVMVTHEAPNFIAPAILGNGKLTQNFNMKEYKKNKYAIVFFWPMDFTFVCPSELIAFNKRYKNFKKRNVKLIGISIDSIFVHQQWKKTKISDGGIGEVKYVMVSDIKRKIQKSYCIEDSKNGVALRASFLIDKNNIIRHQTVNDLPLGRNIDEILRIIDALQIHEKNGNVCPAQWKKNKKTIKPTFEGITKYLSNNLDDL